jgi:hypothetical protein
VRFLSVGADDPQVGSASQLAVFSKNGAALVEATEEAR